MNIQRASIPSLVSTRSPQEPWYLHPTRLERVGGVWESWSLHVSTKHLSLSLLLDETMETRAVG